jgi:hypothetical protein
VEEKGFAVFAVEPGLKMGAEMPKNNFENSYIITFFKMYFGLRISVEVMWEVLRVDGGGLMAEG